MALDWSRASVLVTGATGFLGGRLTRALVARGARVTAIVRDKIAHSPLEHTGLARSVSVVHGDLVDETLISRVLAEYEVQVVFHLAAQSIVGVALRSPLSTFETNIRGTYNLLEAARRCPGVHRVIVASSDKVYGASGSRPCREDDPLAGRFPYDVSKACADLLAQSYHETFQLPVAITRCANLYGPGDLNFNRLIPETIRAFLRGEQPVIRSDGRPRREYLYVEDAVEGYLALAERLDQPGVAGRPFNFSAGTCLSVLEVVDAVAAAASVSHVKPTVLGTAASEISEQRLDSSRARDVLSWTAKHTFAEGLAETIPWYRELLAGLARAQAEVPRVAVGR